MYLKWLKTPALASAIGIMVGIVTGYCVFDSSNNDIIFWLAAGSCAIALAIYFLLKRADVAFGALMVGIGLVLGNGSIPQPLPDELVATKGRLSGTVFKVKSTDDTERVFIHARQWLPANDSVPADVDFNVICTIHRYDNNIAEGMTMTVNGRLNDISPATDVPYQTDYSRFLSLDGVTARMSVYDRNDYSVDTNTITPLQRFVLEARNRWLEAVSDIGCNEATTGFLLTVIGGDDKLLSTDSEQQFRQSGLAHILAISGLHVTIILLVLTFVLRPLKLIRRMRPWYFVLLAALCVAYAVVTGSSPSACRAAAMCCVLMGSRLFEVRPNPLQSLAVAVAVLLCFKPVWLFTPGFQFSVCAVLSIIVFMPLLELPNRFGKTVRGLWVIFILPVVAVGGTLIPSLFYYHTFTPNFWIANIVAAVLIPPIIALGFVGAVCSLFGLSSFLVSGATDGLYAIMSGIIDKVNDWLPAAQLHYFPTTQALFAIGFFIVLLYFLLKKYTHLRAFGATIGLVLVILFLPEKTEATSATELYIPRNSEHTEIIIIDDYTSSFLWTSMRHPLERERACSRATTNYRDFFLSRGAPISPTLIETDFASHYFNLDNHFLRVHDKSIYLANGKISGEVPDRHIDYLVVTENYYGNIGDLCTMFRPDSVLLSSAINHSRHQKFVRQLEQSEQPYRSLREAGFALKFQ